MFGILGDMGIIPRSSTTTPTALYTRGGDGGTHTSE
eukprot:COSAG06_NODE_70104_length_194_cov_13.621053_1_plen_35_part_10